MLIQNKKFSWKSKFWKKYLDIQESFNFWRYLKIISMFFVSWNMLLMEIYYLI